MLFASWKAFWVFLIGAMAMLYMLLELLHSGQWLLLAIAVPTVLGAGWTLSSITAKIERRWWEENANAQIERG